MSIREYSTDSASLRHPDRAGSRTERYQIHISDDLADGDWDAFLAETPGGHHVQTSLWAQVKSVLGWQPLRLVCTQEGQIVAGVQLLRRRLPLLGAVGYVSKGPVLASPDPALAAFVVQALQRTARRHRIQHLTVQPPNNGSALAECLPGWRFRPSSVDVAPTATLLLDLSKSVDDLMAEMSTKTRYNVRLSARKQIRVRAGDEDDLTTYYQLLTATGQRQKFTPYPERYFREMWRILRPHGCINLLLAEFEQEVVSAQLSVAFGETVTNKLSVWSGRHGNRRPNEALQWAAIQWAKENGYRYYDFEGIKPEAAQALQQGEPLPETLKQSVTSFKLGFGGQAALFPGTYDYVYNPILRWGYAELFPRIRHQRRVKQLVKRLRTQAH